jgi:hypothetical protein
LYEGIELRLNYKSAANNATNNAKINANGTNGGVNEPATKEQEQVKKNSL